MTSAAGALDVRDDELGGECGDAAEPALLPGADERAGQARCRRPPRAPRVNASRRPAHSRQRSTGQAVGAPQRPQHGGPSGRSSSRQAGAEQSRPALPTGDAATREEKIEQPRHRTLERGRVTCLSRNWHEKSTIRSRG